MDATMDGEKKSGQQSDSEIVPPEPPQSLAAIIGEKAPETLNAIPKGHREKLKAITVEQRRIVISSGPVPDPATLAAYNDAVPDGANRIMKMAEAQSVHRMSLEAIAVREQQSQSARGQWFGLIIALVGIGAGAYVTISGHPVVGGSIATTTVISLVSAFVLGKRLQISQLAMKRPTEVQPEPPQKNRAHSRSRRR